MDPLRNSDRSAPMILRTCLLPLALLCCVTPALADDDDLMDRVEHGYADSDGVKIHYARLGADDSKELVVMIHGYPDYWYTWRDQMDVLAHDYTVVAMDQRGYNRSDAPVGVDHYSMGHLVRDVLAVIRDNGRERAILVGHDWGAAVAWQVAMSAPQSVARLVILSVPHPAGFGRELANNESQNADSQYARDFQAPDSHLALTATGLAGWVPSADVRAKYVEAFERSSFDAMMNYYRKNFPSQASANAQPAAKRTFPRIQCPVLVLHGLQDRALHASGHNDTWEQVDAETTLVMFPQAGHFVQSDASERVSYTILNWLSL